MKNVILTVFFLLMLSSLSAQLYIGPKLGLAVSYDDTYNDGSYTDATVVSRSLVPGINVGAMLMYRFGVLSIRWEPMYIELKGKLNMMDIYERDFLLEQKRTYWRNNFLLDVGFEINDRARFFGQVGPTVEFLLNSERVIDGNYYIHYKDLRQVDFGITVGIGALVKIKKNWLELNIRANHGLTAYKYIEGGWFGYYFYNANISYNVAYIFIIPNKNRKPKKKETRLFY